MEKRDLLSLLVQVLFYNWTAERVKEVERERVVKSRLLTARVRAPVLSRDESRSWKRLWLTNSKSQDKAARTKGDIKVGVDQRIEWV